MYPGVEAAVRALAPVRSGLLSVVLPALVAHVATVVIRATVLPIVG